MATRPTSDRIAGGPTVAGPRRPCFAFWSVDAVVSADAPNRGDPQHSTEERYGQE